MKKPFIVLATTLIAAVSLLTGCAIAPAAAAASA